MLLLTPKFIEAQEEVNFEKIKGSYTIFVKSLKESKQVLSEDQLLEIETLRKDDEDFETSIDDMKVLIMSREKMEADFRWPRYTLLND